MLEKTFLNNTLENWGISVLIIIGALLLNKIIQILNRRVFRRIATKAKTDFIDILLDSLESPVLFGVMIIAVVIALGRLELGETPNLIKAYKLLITLDVTWFFARLLASLLERSFKSRETEHGGRKKKRRLDPKFLPLTRRCEAYQPETERSNSRYRVRRLREILGNAALHGTLDRKTACRALGDHCHFPGGICRHCVGGDERIATTAAVVVEPGRGCLYACKGPPCSGRWRRYRFSGT